MKERRELILNKAARIKRFGEEKTELTLNLKKAATDFSFLKTEICRVPAAASAAGGRGGV